METGESRVFEEPGTLADGTKVIYLSSKSPLRNQKNKIIGMVGISIDVTKLRKQNKD